jgi:hypothetical protein
MYNRALYTYIKVYIYAATVLMVRLWARLWPSQPPIQWVKGALFPEVKQTENEADRSLLSTRSTDVNSEWSYTSAPLICLYGVYRDNFTFVLNIDGSSIQKTEVGTIRCAQPATERSSYP